MQGFDARVAVRKPLHEGVTTVAPRRSASLHTVSARHSNPTPERGRTETSSSLVIPSTDAQPRPVAPGIGRVPRWEPIPSHEYGKRSGEAVLEGALETVLHGSTAVLTGAGMSTVSGLPDYRGRDAVPRTPMTYQEFVSSPASRQRYWARSSVGWPLFTEAEPNRAHRSLVDLEHLARFTGIITQNVDALHQRAGSTNVLDLHGRLDRVICLSCRRVTPRDELQITLVELNPWLAERLDDLARDARQAPDGDAEVDRVDDFRYPGCQHCGGIVKPDVVFFGESAHPDVVAKAFDLVNAADALLVLGSSLSVQSGFRFVRHAVKHHIPVVVVGDGPTRADDLDILRVHGRLEDVLPAWVTRAQAERHIAWG